MKLDKQRLMEMAGIKKSLNEGSEDSNASSIEYIQEMSQEISLLLTSLTENGDFEQKINQWLEANKDTRLGLATPLFSSLLEKLKAFQRIFQ